MKVCGCRSSKTNLTEIRDKYGDERKTEMVHSSAEMNTEDFIEDEDVVITISREGYIKRTPLTEYRRQGRGGKGCYRQQQPRCRFY